MRQWLRRYFLQGILALSGLVSCAVGAVFTYRTHFEHPQYQYLPADQEWRDHLHEVLEASRRGVAASGSAQLTIDVSGAVAKPGVYQISSGSRLQEAILAAGGFVADADKQYIHRQLNLADTVRDGAKVYVPFTGESTVADTAVKGSGDTADGITISVNTATAKELQALPGIGEKRAGEIVDGRPFTDQNDLTVRTSISDAMIQTMTENGYQLIY